MNILDDFMKRFIPPYQLYVLKLVKQDNKKEFSVLEEKLLKIRETLQQMPTYWDVAEWEAKDIKVGLHYFLGDYCDWFIGTVNLSNHTEPSFGFARLNNDYYNAELGSIYIQQQLLTLHGVQLDLDWDTSITIQDVMDENKKLLAKCG